jgi:hypothetical protein
MSGFWTSGIFVIYVDIESILEHGHGMDRDRDRDREG